MERNIRGEICTLRPMESSHLHTSCVRHRVMTRTYPSDQYIVETRMDKEIPMFSMVRGLMCILEHCGTTKTVDPSTYSTIWCDGVHLTQFLELKDRASYADKQRMTLSTIKQITAMLNSFMEGKRRLGLGQSYSRKVDEVVASLKETNRIDTVRSGLNSLSDYLQNLEASS